MAPVLTVFSMKLASCHPFGAYSSETAPRYLENLWTLDLINLGSLKGYSIIYSFFPYSYLIKHISFPSEAV